MCFCWLFADLFFAFVLVSLGWFQTNFGLGFLFVMVCQYARTLLFHQLGLLTFIFLIYTYAILISVFEFYLVLGALIEHLLL